MRLDSLRIGSEKASPTHAFKNLKNVTIDFDQDHWVTVVIGWNGTGKSNVLEALATIFRDLIQGKRRPAFAFRLRYRMGVAERLRYIDVEADPDRERDPFIIHVEEVIARDGISSTSTTLPMRLETADVPRGSLTALSKFLQDEANLPRYVFSYYSGESARMSEVFRPYLESYDKRLRNGEDPGPKRLFFALPVHSQFVLLAFLIQQNDQIRAFLVDHLGLDPEEGLESVLFVLRQPPWNSKAPDGDDRFWNARGVVREFLSRLYEIALAPVRVTRREPVSLWNQKTLEFLYLYVKDIAALRALVGSQPAREFFRDLESTYVSELIDEVRIRVKLKKNHESVTFRELSEGEQQLLTVLGLLRFTATEESLFLLDEPDTHLNPRWCVDYLGYLKGFAGTEGNLEQSRHVVLTTHNPLAIAELVREQVQILSRDRENGAIIAQEPELDPRGMGYAGIVTSDMFGLAAALDKHTQQLLEDKRELSLKEGLLSDRQREDLNRINSELERYGFQYSMRDPVFEEYLRARYAYDHDRPQDNAVSTLAPKERRRVARTLIQRANDNVKKDKDSRKQAK